jgi:hypothetical protein
VADGTAIAAVLTGTAAVLTAWAAVKRAKSHGTEECEENLAEARKEAEAQAVEVHRLRMAHPEDYKEPDHKEEIEDEDQDK